MWLTMRIVLSSSSKKKWRRNDLSTNEGLQAGSARKYGKQSGRGPSACQWCHGIGGCNHGRSIQTQDNHSKFKTGGYRTDRLHTILMPTLGKKKRFSLSLPSTGMNDPGMIMLWWSGHMKKWWRIVENSSDTESFGGSEEDSGTEQETQDSVSVEKRVKSWIWKSQGDPSRIHKDSAWRWPGECLCWRKAQSFSASVSTRGPRERDGFCGGPVQDAFVFLVTASPQKTSFGGWKVMIRLLHRTAEFWHAAISGFCLHIRNGRLHTSTTK